MSLQTTNLALTKIELTDAPPDITVLNANWDTLDEAVTGKQSKITATGLLKGGGGGAVAAAARGTDYSLRTLGNNITIAAADWTGSSAPYTAVKSVAGLLATDTPHITPVYSTVTATAIAQKAAWNLVGEGKATAGTLTFKCLEEKPTVALTLQVEVIR